MRWFRQGRVAAAFMAIAGAMLGEDAVLKRRQEQAAWNRDESTFSDWRKKQNQMARSARYGGNAPAKYINEHASDRAYVRYDRAARRLEKRNVPGRGFTPAETRRIKKYQTTDALLPTHILRNAGVRLVAK